MAEIEDDPLTALASEHATARVPTAAPGETVGEVRSRLGAGGRFDSADEVVVLDGPRLAGIVGIERLLGAGAETAIATAMDAHPPTIGPGHDPRVAARNAVHRGESSLAVIDGEGRFAGLIPAPRVMALLLAAHDSDLARIGGYVAGTARAQRAALEPIGRRFLHRVPWLLVGLFGAMASALIVGSFERELEENVLLALFITAIVYMAGAVGTQTQTVLIRALATGIGVGQVFVREAVTGVLLGAIVGAVFLPFALVVWGDADVALAVGLALFASCTVSTVVAVVLPAVLQRLGKDPAFGSGPIATVIQDILSITIYFAIAVAIV